MNMYNGEHKSHSEAYRENWDRIFGETNFVCRICGTIYDEEPEHCPVCNAAEIFPTLYKR